MPAARRILALAGAQRIVGPQILEGGSIHVDGQGTLITTEQCLLDPNRNPHLSKADIEGYLKEFLGVSTVIWLKGGLKDDLTDGHVDQLAAFVKPGVVLALTCEDEADV